MLHPELLAHVPAKVVKSVTRGDSYYALDFRNFSFACPSPWTVRLRGSSRNWDQTVRLGSAKKESRLCSQRFSESHFGVCCLDVMRESLDGASTFFPDWKRISRSQAPPSSGYITSQPEHLEVQCIPLVGGFLTLERKGNTIALFLVFIWSCSTDSKNICVFLQRGQPSWKENDRLASSEIWL